MIGYFWNKVSYFRVQYIVGVYRMPCEATSDSSKFFEILKYFCNFKLHCFQARKLFHCFQETEESFVIELENTMIMRKTETIALREDVRLQ